MVQHSGGEWRDFNKREEMRVKGNECILIKHMFDSMDDMRDILIKGRGREIF